MYTVNLEKKKLKWDKKKKLYLSSVELNKDDITEKWIYRFFLFCSHGKWGKQRTTHCFSSCPTSYNLNGRYKALSAGNFRIPNQHDRTDGDGTFFENSSSRSAATNAAAVVFFRSRVSLDRPRRRSSRFRLVRIARERPDSGVHWYSFRRGGEDHFLGIFFWKRVGTPFGLRTVWIP